MQRKVKRVIRGRMPSKFRDSNKPCSRHPHPGPLPKGEGVLLERWRKALDAATADREAIDAQARAVFAGHDMRNPPLGPP
jgi:hypothetical protein